MTEKTFHIYTEDEVPDQIGRAFVYDSGTKNGKNFLILTQEGCVHEWRQLISKKENVRPQFYCIYCLKRSYSPVKLS